MRTRKTIAFATMLMSFCAAMSASAMAQQAQTPWDKDWSFRRGITVDAATVQSITEPVKQAAVLVRIHSGVLDFTKAAKDGSDIRFVNGTDGAPLDFHFERFDPVAEIAYVWVEMPVVVPGVPQQLWLYHGNNQAVPVMSSADTYDGYVSYVLHLDDQAGIPVDATVNKTVFEAMEVAPTLTGIVGGGVELTAASSIEVQANQSLQIGAEDGALTFAAWLRPEKAEEAAGDAAAGDVGEADTTVPAAAESGEGAEEGEAGTQKSELIFSKKMVEADEAAEAEAAPEGEAAPEAGGDLSLLLVDGKPVLRLGEQEWSGETALPKGQWSHLALVADDATVRLYLNGELAAEGEAELPPMDGAEVIGAIEGQTGFAGTIDEIYRANSARSASHIALMANTQGPRASLVTFAPQMEEIQGPSHDYFAILFNALTPDAWAVIILLAIMSAISWMIMFSKSRLFGRTNRANQKFLQYYRENIQGLQAREGLSGLSLTKAHCTSSIARLFSVGQDALNRRIAEEGDSPGSYVAVPESVAAIRSVMSAGAVNEEHRLGRRMVLLTIAISGGPFLGLLGTVLGVMITFAGVAAAGEVNVTAIAPGIAAALLATVAGLAVAIPALFGYNYLTGQLDNILADNQVFIDELEKSIAESFRTARPGHVRAAASFNQAG